MSAYRKTPSSKPAAGLAMALALLLGGCTMLQGPADREETYEGPPVAMGHGVARSYVVLDVGGKPATIGIRLSAAALEGLPAEEPAGAHGVEYLLELPPQASATGYDHIGLDWNPHGHIPPGIYDTPHFDFHFYMISRADRAKITAVGSDLDRAHKAPAPELMPAGYALPPGTEVPNMGAHAIDPQSGEFNGKPFTKTFIYGFYDGKMIFLEPMVTKAYLESHPDENIPVAAPAVYAKRGYYPTGYGIRYDAARGEYDISMTGLTLHLGRE